MLKRSLILLALGGLVVAQSPAPITYTSINISSASLLRSILPYGMIAPPPQVQFFITDHGVSDHYRVSIMTPRGEVSAYCKATLPLTLCVVVVDVPDAIRTAVAAYGAPTGSVAQ